jgi:uncharacterized protein
MNPMPDEELIPANASTPAAPVPQPEPEPVLPSTRPRGIAPIWHTLVLVAGILAFSIWGAMKADTGDLNPLAPVHGATHATTANGTDRLRLIRYGLTGALELTIVAWVALGLRLRKIPLRSLFGAWPRDLNSITLEAGVALIFWLCSMLVLASAAVTWQFVENQIYQHQLKSQAHNQSHSSAKPESPLQKQSEMARQLMELAPANGIELAAWGFLCVVVGFSEELVFRGYLQSQGIALLQRIPLSVLLASLVFGAAHGYQGLRGICIITIYGALFSGLTLLRRNLFPGMLAHSWHDFATGLLLAFLRSSHILEHLPPPK